MADLQDPRLMVLKAALFLGIAGLSVVLILAESTSLMSMAKILVLLGLLVWSACRLYYFAFYVIERYIDPTFRFAGLWSVLVFLCSSRWRHRRVSPPSAKDQSDV